MIQPQERQSPGRPAVQAVSALYRHHYPGSPGSLLLGAGFSQAQFDAMTDASKSDGAVGARHYSIRSFRLAVSQ
jgi:hypothetical protein